MSKILQTVLAFCVALGIVFAIGMFVLSKYDVLFSKKPTNTANALLTEKEARNIAENSCIKGGEALGSGTYNEYSKTWWFSANLNSRHEGCNPACVVKEETRTAEINYRCTGLNNPDTKPPVITSTCGIENCHGLDIVCGSNPAQMCTEMYQLGDRCRQFATCGVVNGSCKQIEDTQFTACKTCVQACEKKFPNDPEQVFQCENTCGENL